MKKQPQTKSLKNRALRLLTFRDLTCEQLRHKLVQEGFCLEDIENVIEWLIDLRYLDDRRTAQLWVEYRNRWRPMGIYGLKYELQHQGVSKEIIDEVVNSPEEDYNLAFQLARKRMKKVVGLPKRKQYQRIGGLLNRRGFSSDVIRRVLDSLFQLSLDTEK